MGEWDSAERLTEAVGWALVHFIWQGAAVALLYAAFAALAARSSARARYMGACVALALMLALPVATLSVNLSARRTAPAPELRTESGLAPEQGARAARTLAGGENALPSETRAGLSEAPGNSQSFRVWAEWAESRVASLVPWLVCLWLVGVVILAARTGGGWLGVRRLRRSARPAPPEFEPVLSNLAARLGVGRAVRLCQSALVEVPTVVGHLRPMVLVPLSAFVGLTPSQLEAVLAHELAHVRRYDFLVNLLQTVVETLLFYHPAVWWVSGRVRQEREHACDDVAVAAVGDALLYARALAAIEALRPPRGSVPGLALAANGGSLMQRINRLVRPHAATRTRSSLVAALVLVALCGAGVFARAILPTETDARDSGARPGAAMQGRQVAFTFVNFPGNNVQDNRRLVPKTRKLIRALAAHQIKAVGFVNEGTLYRADGALDEERVGLLREWLGAGHELGNETFRHTSLYNVSLAEWQADVERGEQVMSKLLAERGERLRYFSYPYLNTGSDAAEKLAAEKYLKDRGYQIHPVTVDNMDWLFSRAYLEALRAGDEPAAARIRADYIPYMERMFEFYESYSREVVGREFPQVLMLTGGPLNADTLDQLVAMLKRRGYSFVTMEQATRDAAYQMADTYTGRRGDSWLRRWAISKGLPERDVEEEYLPPSMQKYLDDFLKQQQRAKSANK